MVGYAHQGQDARRVNQTKNNHSFLLFSSESKAMQLRDSEPAFLKYSSLIYGTWNNISETVVFAKEVGTVLLFFIDILNSKNLQKPKGKLAGLCTSRQALQRKWRRSASMCPRTDPFQFLSRLQISQIKKFRSRAERDVM